jgi:selenocysteine-specific translation elongation factor
VVLATSARTGAGISELRSAIARLLKERGAD